MRRPFKAPFSMVSASEDGAIEGSANTLKLMREQRLFGALLALGLFAAATPFAAAEKPHVVLITIDTLRADRLEAYGWEKAETPATSALAQEGVLFENVIAQTPITLPSHASILSGTYPIYHGLQDVVGRMRPDVTTLADWLKESGYKTAAFVGSSVLAAAWGLNRGFDFYEDTFQYQGLRQIDFSRVERPAQTVVELAEEWLTANLQGPVFVWVHLYDPHDPYIPPEPFATRFKDRPYDGEIAYVDAQLARFFEFLKNKGIWDNSLIVLASDHGESLGEHEEQYHAYYIYDASIRVPLILRLPESVSKGRIQRGLRIPNQVRTVDVAPTLMQLLRLPIPAQVQGESLVALMSGKRPNLQLPAYAETHYPRIHFGWSPLFSYSTPTHKFIEAPIPELYDLKDDPGELKNVVSQNQALANRLREELHALQRKYAPADGGSGEATEVDAETVERLKSLGYVAFSAGGTSRPALDLPDPKLKIGVYNQLNGAIVHSREGRTRQALEQLKKIAVLEPEMPLVHFLMGSEYLRLELYLQAVQEFSRTIELNPGSNVARYNLARSQLNAGLSAKSEATLRELLDLDPRHYGARHLLATILGKKGDFEAAAAQEKEALQVRPNSVDSNTNLGTYYFNLGRIQEAAEHYRKALAVDPRNLPARLNLSLCHLRLKQFGEARREAERAVADYPNAPLGHFYLGQAYLGLGLKDEARSAFQRAKRLNPGLEVPIS